MPYRGGESSRHKEEVFIMIFFNLNKMMEGAYGALNSIDSINVKTKELFLLQRVFRKKTRMLLHVNVLGKSTSSFLNLALKRKRERRHL